MAVTVDFQELHEVIDAMKDRANNAGPIMSDVASMLVKQADQGFEKAGPGWQALAPTTIAKKGHALILIDSGNMRKSAKGTIGSDYAMLTIDSPAGFHADGGPNLPRRDPLAFFSDETVNSASTLILDWILE